MYDIKNQWIIFWQIVEQICNKLHDCCQLQKDFAIFLGQLSTLLSAILLHLSLFGCIPGVTRTTSQKGGQQSAQRDLSGRVSSKVEIFLRTVSSISLISLKIQILGGKVLFKILGFDSQCGRVKFFAIFLFFFTFSILSIKN